MIAVGIRPFQRNPEPEVITILKLVLVPVAVVLVEEAFVEEAAWDEVADVVTTSGEAVTTVGLPSGSRKIFSRPIFEMIFSDGVIGNMIKNTRIRNVISTKQPHDRRVIFVDFFRSLKKPMTLVIVIHTPKIIYNYCITYFVCCQGVKLPKPGLERAV